MGYALIWIESLATLLLLVAAITAWSARLARPFWQRLGPILLALVGIGLAVWWTSVIGYMNYGLDLHIGWFSYSLVWTIAFSVGAMVLLWLGLRRRPDAGAAARSWSGTKLAVAFAALVLVTWTTFTNMDTAVKLELRSVRAEAGAKILALAPPRVADADNAALVYQDAFTQLTPESQTPARFRDSQLWTELEAGRIDPKDKEIRDFVAGQQTAILLLRKAAAMPACSFDHDYFAGGDLMLPEVMQLRRSSWLLGLDALDRAAKGDVAAAMEDVSAMFGIARHVNDPILISMIVSANLEKNAIRTLEAVLAGAAPAADHLAGLTLDDRLSFQRRFQRACHMEEWGLGISAYTLLGGDSETGAGAKWLRHEMGPTAMAIVDSPLYRVFFLPDDLAGFRRIMRRVQELAQRPYYETVQDYENKNFVPFIFQAPTGIIAKLIIPATGRCASVAAEADAGHQLARVALAATHYRLKHGKHADRLDELVPQHLDRVPRDPFDGQPLRMRREGKGVLFYSIGRDLTDNGGLRWNEEKREGDVVFRLP